MGLSVPCSADRTAYATGAGVPWHGTLPLEGYDVGAVMLRALLLLALTALAVPRALAQEGPDFAREVLPQFS